MTSLPVADCYTHDTPSRNWRRKSTPFFWRRFLVRVSCKSVTGFVWCQFLVPDESSHRFDTRTRNRRQKMEPIYGAGSWSMCHGYNNAIQYNEIIYNAHKVEKSNLRCGQSLGGRRCGRWL